MNYNLKKPCANCPFLADDSKAVRLSRTRAEEIGGMMLSFNGGDFICHKTSSRTNDLPESEESHCAGAIAFALKFDNMTQMMRISERLHLFKPEEFLEIDPDTIIDCPEDMAHD